MKSEYVDEFLLGKVIEIIPMCTNIHGTFYQTKHFNSKRYIIFAKH